jgi:hypothetical protein
MVDVTAFHFEQACRMQVQTLSCRAALTPAPSSQGSAVATSSNPGTTCSAVPP